MRIHQEARNKFIADREVFQDTKTPYLLWKKLFEEGREGLGAYFKYLVSPTFANRQHLGEELSDMVFIIIDMATSAQIDLHQSMTAKLEKDTKRFPPETLRREAGKTPHQIYMRRKIALGERKSR